MAHKFDQMTFWEFILLFLCFHFHHFNPPLQVAGPAGKVGFSKAMSAGWIVLDKSAGGAPVVTRKVDSITDTIKV
jgi:hypothetical protein